MFRFFRENSRFIIETLEPALVDSYFNWGFFDGILQQKNGFPAMFLKTNKCPKYFNENPELKKDFELKATDSSFAGMYSFSFIYLSTPPISKELSQISCSEIGTR